MRAWKIGRLAGIDISIHWSFLLLVAWVAMSSPAGGAFGSVVLLLAVFGCVLLHELGHAWRRGNSGLAPAASRSCQLAASPIWNVCQGVPRRNSGSLSPAPS